MNKKRSTTDDDLLETIKEQEIKIQQLTTETKNKYKESTYLLWNGLLSFNGIMVAASAFLYTSIFENEHLLTISIIILNSISAFFIILNLYDIRYSYNIKLKLPTQNTLNENSTQEDCEKYANTHHKYRTVLSKISWWIYFRETIAIIATSGQFIFVAYKITKIIMSQSIK